MSGQALHESQPDGKKGRRSLFPPDFMRILTVLSVVPAYAIGGALLGYVADRAFGTSPFLIAAGLLIALALAVRDLLRLRNEFHRGGEDEVS
jgi:F0F1-type ATP synthase assembly protein I